MIENSKLFGVVMAENLIIHLCSHQFVNCFDKAVSISLKYHFCMLFAAMRMLVRLTDRRSMESGDSPELWRKS